MKYSDFQLSATLWLERLHGSLCEFEVLLFEAKKNERVAKAVAMYALSEDRNFKALLAFAQKDDFAKQMITDLHWGLMKTTYSAAKQVAQVLISQFFKDETTAVVKDGTASLYAEEYSKYLTSIVLEHEQTVKRSEQAEMHAEQMMNKVDMVKLFV